MKVFTEKYGFGTEWDYIFIDSYEGFYPNMSNYHMHEYFEISFIVSGNVNILLTDSAERSIGSKIVLLRPFTPHYIYCEPDILYRRTNICFSKDVIESLSPEFHRIMSIFGKNGTVLALDNRKIEEYLTVVKQIDEEENLFRKKLLVMYLISLIADNMEAKGDFSPLPQYVTNALSYISNNYTEKIIAADLAQKLNVGRTTLMQGFKKHTGTTINEYLLGCRLKKAVTLLEEGKNLWEIAENCGFTDAPNLIRCFKKHFGVTPGAWQKNSN